MHNGAAAELRAEGPSVLAACSAGAGGRTRGVLRRGPAFTGAERSEGTTSPQGEWRPVERVVGPTDAEHVWQPKLYQLSAACPERIRFPRRR
jgi:hypothetical protein